MQLSTSTAKRLVPVVAVAGLLAVATYAFTASNVMPGSSKAGDGSTVISGFTVSSLDYTLGASPKDITAMAFKLDGNVASTTTVKIQLDDPLGSWYDCTIGTVDAGPPEKTNVSCTTTGATVAAADKLTVVAVD